MGLRVADGPAAVALADRGFLSITGVPKTKTGCRLAAQASLSGAAARQGRQAQRERCCAGALRTSGQPARSARW